MCGQSGNNHPVANIWRQVEVAHFFSAILECLTVSNALLKLSAITMMYSFLSNKFEIVCSIAMRAAVVDPAGLNANWSSNVSWLAGEMSDGYNSSLTTIFSIIHDVTGVIEIGR